MNIKTTHRDDGMVTVTDVDTGISITAEDEELAKEKLWPHRQSNTPNLEEFEDDAITVEVEWTADEDA